MSDRSSPHLDLEIVAAVLRGHSDDLALYAGFGQRLTAVLRHQSGGVVKSTRIVSVDDWSAALAVDLARLVRTNGAAVAALAYLTAPKP